MNLLVQREEVCVEDDQLSIFGCVEKIVIAGHFVVVELLLFKKLNYSFLTAFDTDHRMTMAIVMRHIHSFPAERK